jgi:outer membrane biosynthesis protein TonB
VAKVIYAVTAAALAALVAGFFVDTSNVPLFTSIALSAVVMFLILFGWSRRIRSGMDLLGDVQQTEVVEDLAVVELAEEEFHPPARRKRPTVTGVSTPADVTAVIERPARAKTRPKPKPAAKPKPPVKPKPAAKPKPLDRPKSKPAAKRAAPKPVPRKRAAAVKAPAKRPAARKAPAKKKKKAPTKRVVVIPGRERYHRRGCRFAQTDEAREVRESTARDRGYEPCSVCSP